MPNQRNPQDPVGHTALATLVQELRSNMLTVQAATTEAYAILDLMQTAIDDGTHNMNTKQAADLQLLITGSRAYLANDEDGMAAFD